MDYVAVIVCDPSPAKAGNKQANFFVKSEKVLDTGSQIDILLVLILVINKQASR